GRAGVRRASALSLVRPGTAAATGSPPGARPSSPWQWDGASPGWQIALPVAAAAFVAGTCAATAAVAASGRLTRWLPDHSRLASTSAIASGIAIGAVDLILLLLLTHQLARAPATLDTTPVTIAALVSTARLASAQQSIRRPRTA